MPNQKMLILNQSQIAHKIDRIAYQILEDNFDESELVIAGIVDRGYVLAERLYKKIGQISKLKLSLIKIDIEKKGSELTMIEDIDLKKCNGKSIVLVDDVLNSGRTLAYGLGVFLNIPTKKIRTVVLVDRSHKIFPVSVDFVGFSIATTLKEHVSVHFSELQKEDAVYLA